MSDKFAIDHIIGSSAWTERVRKRIVQVAGYRYSVLVTGPSGTGKELVARAIHTHGNRCEKPFIPVGTRTRPLTELNHARTVRGRDDLIL